MTVLYLLMGLEILAVLLVSGLLLRKIYVVRLERKKSKKIYFKDFFMTMRSNQKPL